MTVFTDDTEGWKKRALAGEEDARYWRDRCRRMEQHHVRLQQASAEVRGAVERFLVVLQAAQPQGTEPRA